MASLRTSLLAVSLLALHFASPFGADARPKDNTVHDDISTTTSATRSLSGAPRRLQQIPQNSNPSLQRFFAKLATLMAQLRGMQLSNGVGRPTAAGVSVPNPTAVLTAPTTPTPTRGRFVAPPTTPAPRVAAKPGGAFALNPLPPPGVPSVGTFNNPLLYADFADPDVIRVNDTFYMAVTSMHMVPGTPILRSYDLVNWEFLSYAVPRLEGPCYSMENCTRYGVGPWANSLRYNNGTFYVLYNINDQGAYLSTATDPAGPWTPRKLNWTHHDPGLLFDDDGRIYVAYGQHRIDLVELDQDFNEIPGTTVNMVNNDVLYPGIEGSHLYKIDGWYYNYLPWGGGWGKQVTMRSPNATGPYEITLALDDKMGYKEFGVRQGSLVDTLYGEWWSVLMQDRDSVGRIAILQPVNWTGGWPIPGVDGKGVYSGKRPAGLDSRGVKLQMSDEFNETTLGLQWQWNHNPNDTRWTLTERPGYMRLKTAKALPTANLTLARNQLTQRVWGPESEATVELDAANLVDGDTAGLSVFQNPYGYIAVRQTGGVKSLVVDFNGEVQATAPFAPPAPGGVVILRATFAVANQKAQFSYSYDGVVFTKLGAELQTGWDVKQFVGYRFGLFVFNTAGSLLGAADFNWFRMGGAYATQPQSA